MKAFTPSTLEMADATRKRVQILADQYAMKVMIMPNKLIKTKEVQKYMKLKREEEFAKIRVRMALKFNLKTAVHLTKPLLIKREET